MFVKHAQVSIRALNQLRVDRNAGAGAPSSAGGRCTTYFAPEPSLRLLNNGSTGTEPLVASRPRK